MFIFVSIYTTKLKRKAKNLIELKKVAVSNSFYIDKALMVKENGGLIRDLARKVDGVRQE